jgi:glucose-1-phosphate thymidylyltransferase
VRQRRWTRTRVVVQQGARIINSHVRGPAVIGRDAVIENSYVGPYSSISTGCVVRRAEIEHSILLERVHIEDLEARVECSLIGRDVTISRTDAKPRAYRFVLGDSSVIGLT